VCPKTLASLSCSASGLIEGGEEQVGSSNMQIQITKNLTSFGVKFPPGESLGSYFQLAKVVMMLDMDYIMVGLARLKNKCDTSPCVS
jgi:hypothetical protein